MAGGSRQGETQLRRSEQREGASTCPVAQSSVSFIELLGPFIGMNSPVRTMLAVLQDAAD